MFWYLPSSSDQSYHTEVSVFAHVICTGDSGSQLSVLVRPYRAGGKVLDQEPKEQASRNSL